MFALMIAANRRRVWSGHGCPGLVSPFWRQGGDIDFVPVERTLLSAAFDFAFDLGRHFDFDFGWLFAPDFGWRSGLPLRSLSHAQLRLQPPREVAQELTNACSTVEERRFSAA
jgi:hypothetical protein